MQDLAPCDICVLFSLTAAVHSGKCMFNSFTIYGVMRTMSVSEGIIASRRGCWRVQVGWHLDFESGLAGIGSAGPTIAPITKLPGMGRGFKVTPCRPGELQEPFPGMVAGSQPRLPGTSEGCGSGAAFLQPAFTSKFFCSANPCPLKKQRFPTPSSSKTPSPLGPWPRLPKSSFCWGCGEGFDPSQCPQQPHGVLEAPEVKSIHMEGPGARCVSQLSPRQLCSQPPNKAH